jgi:hypothetical protein
MWFYNKIGVGFLLLAWCLLSAPFAGAHVGSPGVVYQDQAGPYRVLVSINPPDVIPGTAQVSVFVEGGGITKVTARPIFYNSGDEGAPAADEMKPAADAPGRYEGMVWLMSNGSSSVQVVVEGSAGRGEALVPVMAVATAQREMPAQLSWILGGLAVFLFLLMVTILGASVSDGTLKPGLPLTAARKRKRLATMGLSVVVLGCLLFVGRNWWNGWAEDYRKYMYRPMQAAARVETAEGREVLTLRVDTTGWGASHTRISYLVPDHGKLMHLFLVREPGLDAFAHLHPNRLDSLTFQAALPPLPPGRYKVYGDIVHRSGYAETITGTAEIPAQASIRQVSNVPTAGDAEDTYVVTDPLDRAGFLPADTNAVLCGKPGVKAKLQDGSAIIWEHQANTAFTTGRVYPLRFMVTAPDGKPARLDPYLGMAGHAVVTKDDGSVFIHLHPVGTYSMAARQSLEKRVSETSQSVAYPDPGQFIDSVNQVVARLDALPSAEREGVLMAGMGHVAAGNGTDATPSMAGMDHGSEVSFPYTFPQPGNYRIWVQVKRDGRILTGAFDAVVK